MQCHSSIASATESTAILIMSWPMPSNQLLTWGAIAASTSAPSTPIATPAPSHRPRPRRPRVAAATMPTKSAASSDSRKTIRAAVNMGCLACGLFRDHRALRGLLVELTVERVAAGLERADEDRRLLPAGDHFLALEAVALELFRRAVLVVDDELDLLARLDLHFGGFELV